MRLLTTSRQGRAQPRRSRRDHSKTFPRPAQKNHIHIPHGLYRLVVNQLLRRDAAILGGLRIAVFLLYIPGTLYSNQSRTCKISLRQDARIHGLLSSTVYTTIVTRWWSCFTLLNPYFNQVKTTNRVYIACEGRRSCGLPP